MGIAISAFEAGRLVAALSEEGSEHGLAAAASIRRKLEAEDGSVVLTDEQADLILALLEATPNRLPELRETLVRASASKRSPAKRTPIIPPPHPRTRARMQDP